MANETKEHRTFEDVLNDLEYLAGDIAAHLCGAQTLRRVDGSERSTGPLMTSVLNLRDMVGFARDVARESKAL